LPKQCELRSLRLTKTFAKLVPMKNLAAISIVALIFFWGCTKMSDTPDSPNLPTVTTTNVTNMTVSSAVSGGTITNNGGSGITARGIVCGTDSLPTIYKNFLKTSDSLGTGSFVSNMKKLSPSTKYFIRAYATNSAGTGYGSSIAFTTADSIGNPPAGSLPIVSTYRTEYLTDTTALGGGRISDTGQSRITAYGVVCGTDSLPTINNYFRKTTEPLAVTYQPFDFGTQLHGLSFVTKYYVRAYATNSAGTGYGNSIPYQSSQSVDALPTVLTGTITNITDSNATAEGNVTRDGGHPIIYRGFVYNIFSMPTLNDAMYTTSAPGTGYYSGNLISLNKLTTYYVRAYATNMRGTSYGDQVVFQTSQNPYEFTLFKDQFIDTTLFTASFTGGANPTIVWRQRYISELQLPPGVNLYIKFDSVYGNISATANDTYTRVVNSRDTMNFNSYLDISAYPDQFSEDSKCFYSIHVEGQAFTSQTEYYCKYSMETDPSITIDFIHLIPDTTHPCSFIH
jgi:hypothetical protein